MYPYLGSAVNGTLEAPKEHNFLEFSKFLDFAGAQQKSAEG